MNLRPFYSRFSNSLEMFYMKNIFFLQHSKINNVPIIKK